MKTITSALSSTISNTTTTLSTCFKVTLRTGIVNSSGASVLTFTDHDEDIIFSAVTYKAATGYTRSAVDTSGEMKTDQLEIIGLIISSAITEKDVRDGVYDYARVEMFLVDWTSPTSRAWLRAGWLGEVKADDTQYTSELRGMAYLLQTVIGNKYTQNCRYVFGDTKCTASVATVTCTVASVINTGAFVGSGALSTTPSRYSGNVVTWFTGSNIGRSMEVKLFDGAGQFQLYLKMPASIIIGDVFTVKSSCNKTLSSTLGCVSHANVINFGGEPHIRGDASFMYAKPSPTADG